jgi:ABC-2 type transport system ATP-binding protein
MLRARRRIRLLRCNHARGHSAAIEVEGIVKWYGRKLAVDGVSLSVAEGEAFGYVGPNGAGKTTTIRCMLGLIRPTAGTIRILGHDIATDLNAVLANLGHLPGEFGLWPQMTGADALTTSARCSGARPSAGVSFVTGWRFPRPSCGARSGCTPGA